MREGKKTTAADLEAMLETMKAAPVRAGEQLHGNHLVFKGTNRQQRRADAAKAAPPSLPKSIWMITALRPGTHLFLGTPVYRISIERRGVTDVLTVYSREGAAPVVGGLLERMTRPRGGEAAIWTDGRATKASIGGGYTWYAVPTEWGFPGAEAVVDEPRRFENLTLGVPFTGPDYRPATREEFVENLKHLGEIEFSTTEVPFGAPEPEIDRVPDGRLVIKGGK